MRGPLLVSAALLLPLSSVVRAGELGADDSCSRADAHSSPAHDGAATRIETVEAALAIEATRPLPLLAPAGSTDAPVPAADFPGTAPRALAAAAAAAAAARLDPATTPLGFRDSAAPRERIRDLKRLRELKLLRLFDTEELMVWLGLDRRGRPGLHFRQRNLDEAMPPVAQAAFLVEPPPLRSVPLTAP
jgi:hypothetical protein